MNKIEFAGLTDETINGLPTAELRALAEDHLVSSWANGRTNVIKEFTITTELVTTPGLLTALEDLIALLNQAYAGRGGKIEHNYGSLSLTVWEDDETLRRRLRERRDQVREEVAETINDELIGS
jgi:hypothetical protein